VTSLRDGVYGVAAADTGAGGVVTLLPDGLGGLLGGPTSEPPPAPSTPYLYLAFRSEFPWAPTNDMHVGSWLWWAYDVEAAGYVRINRLLQRLRQLYGPYRVMGGSYFVDTATGEDVYWVDPPLYSPETEDQARTLLTRYAEWPYRKTHRAAA
jgi:hypothetical protein